MSKNKLSCYRSMDLVQELSAVSDLLEVIENIVMENQPSQKDSGSVQK